MATRVMLLATLGVSWLGLISADPYANGMVLTVHQDPALVGQDFVIDTATHVVFLTEPKQHCVLSNLTGHWQALTGRCGQAGYQDGALADALFHSPNDICLKPGGREMVVADGGNACIRQVDLSGGNVTTLAGTCGSPGFRDGDALSSQFSTALALACQPDGSVLVLDASGHRLRMVVLPLSRGGAQGERS